MLKVQAAHHASLGVGLIVLHHVRRDAVLRVSICLPCFEEESPSIAMDSGLDQQYARYRCLRDLHDGIPLLTSPRR